MLGGGFGGAACAIEAAGLLSGEHRVTLVDRQRVSYLCGANPFLIVGEREPQAMSRSLEDLPVNGVRFSAAEIEAIDLSDKVVHTSAGVEPYDYLVVALGAGYDWERVPGSREAYSFYNHESALRLQDRLASFEGGSVVIGVAGAPIKCPPAPFETAMVIEWALQRRGIGADVHVAIPEPAPLKVAGPEASDRLRAIFENRGIMLHTGAGVAAVDGSTMVLGDGTELAATIPITIPVHRMPAVVVDAGLAGDKPWVPVDRATLETAYPDVFAVGDVNLIPVGEVAVPKAGVFAAGEGRTVARVIASRVLGTRPPDPYDGVGHCLVAFSGTESALVGGDFFADGGPAVALGEPTPGGLADKEDFEARWRAFTI